MRTESPRPEFNSPCFSFCKKKSGGAAKEKRFDYEKFFGAFLLFSLHRGARREQISAHALNLFLSFQKKGKAMRNAPEFYILGMRRTERFCRKKKEKKESFTKEKERNGEEMKER